MVRFFLHAAAIAVWEFEEVDHIQGDIRIGASGQDGFHEHAWCELEERARRLKETIHCGEQFGGNESFQQPKPKV